MGLVARKFPLWITSFPRLFPLKLAFKGKSPGNEVGSAEVPIVDLPSEPEHPKGYENRFTNP